MMENIINNHCQPTVMKSKWGIHRDDVAIAMVHSVLNEELNGPFLCYENEDIKAAAKTYRDWYEQVSKLEAEKKENNDKDKEYETQDTESTNKVEEEQPQQAADDELKNDEK